MFAIAITLLVLSFKVPHLHGTHEDIDAQLWRSIRDQSGTFLSYGLSVFVIGRYWLAHHRMFRLIRHTDALLLELNLIALALVALLPYPTELLGLYGSTKTASVFYASTVAAVGLAHSALWWHAAACRSRRSGGVGRLPSPFPDAWRHHAGDLRRLDPGRVRRRDRRADHVGGVGVPAVRVSLAIREHPRPVLVSHGTTTSTSRRGVSIWGA